MVARLMPELQEPKYQKLERKSSFLGAGFFAKGGAGRLGGLQGARCASDSLQADGYLPAWRGARPSSAVEAVGCE